jgi:3-dehydroquinate dehydratase-2
MKVAIINGPNLNLLGTREKDIYGDLSFEDYLLELKSRYDIELEYFQSNVEGELINRIQELDCDGVVLNAGGYTHTSVSLRDCVAAIETPVVEVHISNIAARESFRNESLLAPVCSGCIFGFGLRGYDLALDFFISK